MLDVSKNGTWEHWICFFADAIEQSALETMVKINAIAELREQFFQQVRQARASGLLPTLIELIFDKLVISVPAAQNKLGVTYRSARHNIDKLVRLGILNEIKIQSRPKIFICNQLTDLVFGGDIKKQTREDEISGGD